MAIAGIGLMGAGLAEGASLAAGTPPADIAAQLQPYRVLAFLGSGLVALAGLAMLVNLFLLYTSRRAGRVRRSRLDRPCHGDPLSDR